MMQDFTWSITDYLDASSKHDTKALFSELTKIFLKVFLTYSNL